MVPAETIAQIMDALEFAADKHRDQRRKNVEASPYINHTIQVAQVLARVGRIHDRHVLQAAVLHDTIEDTETTADELERRFGAAVRRLVVEVTDDTSLPKQERKQLQVSRAERLSDGAKQIKLADKICNIRDVAHLPPFGWSLERRRAYLEWTEAVVAGCRGVSPPLEALYDKLLSEGRATLGDRTDNG